RLERADVNLDGKPDLVVMQEGSGFSVLLNQGGTFSAPIFTALSQDATSLQIGDFNNDHIPDVAVCSAQFNAPDTIQVLLGDGAGHFQPAGQVQVPDCIRFAIGDFNGDGRLDVAVATPVNGTVNGFAATTSNTISVHTGDGAGGFSGQIDTNGLG